MSQDTGHPLNGAYARLARVEDHIEHVELLAREYRQANSQMPLPETEQVSVPPQGRQPVAILQHPQAPVPHLLSILVGEVLYNLRAALDYLVFELAVLDSGSEQDGTQFPIFGTCDGWKSGASGVLRGVSDAHRTQLEELQPYKRADNEWLRTFRALSNPDKHRQLRSVGFASLLTEVRAERHDAPAEDAQGGVHYDMYAKLRMEICFAPRDPFPPMPPHVDIILAVPPIVRQPDYPRVVPTLQDFTSRVRGILDSFKEDFKQ